MNIKLFLGQLLLKTSLNHHILTWIPMQKSNVSMQGIFAFIQSTRKIFYQKDSFFFYFSLSGFSVHLKMLQKLYLSMRGAAIAVQTSVLDHHFLPSFFGAVLIDKWGLFLMLLFTPTLASLDTRIMQVSGNCRDGFSGFTLKNMN